MANHLEDQEQAVAPAAVTEDAPNEKPLEVNGEGKPAEEASPASDEKNGAPEAKEPKTEKPAARPKSAELKATAKPRMQKRRPNHQQKRNRPLADQQPPLRLLRNKRLSRLHPRNPLRLPPVRRKPN